MIPSLMISYKEASLLALRGGKLGHTSKMAAILVKVLLKGMQTKVVWCSLVTFNPIRWVEEGFQLAFRFVLIQII
jgi:hypothetical protein